MANPRTNAENIEHLKQCVEALANVVGDQFQRVNTVSSGNPEFNIEHLITDVKTDLVAAINSLYSVKNDQEIITNSTLLNETHNCKQIIFRSATPITIQIPEFSTARFNCEFFNEGEGVVTFIKQNASVNLNTPDGTALPQEKVACLFKILDENNQVLKGELV